MTEIDGFPVALSGAYHTLVLLAHDEPGTIAAWPPSWPATTSTWPPCAWTAPGRHQDALMTIEADEPVNEAALGAIASFPWLRWARVIPKIA